MKVSMNKNTLKVIIAIIVVIVLIVIGAFAINTISKNAKTKEIENKLSQINAEELKNKIIAELEKTEISVNTYKTKTTFADDVKINNYENYVVAKITTSELSLLDAVYIPFFKIDSDSNGNFKSIEYVPGYSDLGIDVEKIIFDVLENEYNINTEIQNTMTKYRNTKMSIDSTGDRVLVWYVNQVKPRSQFYDIENADDVIVSGLASSIDQEFMTTIFGLDVVK